MFEPTFFNIRIFFHLSSKIFFSINYYILKSAKEGVDWYEEENNVLKYWNKIDAFKQ